MLFSLVVDICIVKPLDLPHVLLLKRGALIGASNYWQVNIKEMSSNTLCEVWYGREYNFSACLRIAEWSDV